MRHRTVTKKFSIFKQAIGCICCGYNKCASALHFHHIEGKDRKISGKAWAAGLVDDEIAKCVLVCSNCHREIHAGITEVPHQ